MDGIEVANRYFASVRARDIGAYVSLFAEGATLITPDGRRFVGVEAIRNMESAVFASENPPTPSPAHIVAGDRSVAVEVDVRLANGVRHRMGSFYQLNSAGLIERLSIYRQAG